MCVEGGGKCVRACARVERVNIWRQRSQAAVNPILESSWTHHGSALHNCLCTPSMQCVRVCVCDMCVYVCGGVCCTKWIMEYSPKPCRGLLQERPGSLVRLDID